MINVCLCAYLVHRRNKKSFDGWDNTRACTRNGNRREMRAVAVWIHQIRLRTLKGKHRKERVKFVCLATAGGIGGTKTASSHEMPEVSVYLPAVPPKRLSRSQISEICSGGWYYVEGVGRFTWKIKHSVVSLGKNSTWRSAKRDYCLIRISLVLLLYGEGGKLLSEINIKFLRISRDILSEVSNEGHQSIKAFLKA